MTQEEKSQKYGCDGVCYSNSSMCPRVDTCPETREKEFWASILAIPVFILTIIAFISIVLISIK